MEKLAIFLQNIDDLATELSNNGSESILYRGQPKYEYKLEPTIFRKELQGNQWGPYTKNLENNLVCNFRLYSSPIIGVDRTDFDVLSLMQHHGAPTRLLDWTTTLGVAVYFALKEERDRPTIWMLNPNALNQKSIGVRGIADSGKIHMDDYGPSYEVQFNDRRKESRFKYFIYPIAVSHRSSDNDRLRVQKGYFTIHGKNHNAIETMGFPFVRQIEIPDDVIDSLKKLLRMMGINEFNVFPDLGGLSRFIVESARKTMSKE